MRFDDTLETVLAADLSTPFGRQSAWRQLVDLIGRRRVRPDSRAIQVLRAIRADVPPPVRAATARMLESADPPEPLARLFVLDEIAIGMPVIRSARLSSDEWIALLPLMAPVSRSVLRNRRDLGPRVVRALEAYGSTDLVLGDGRVPAASHDGTQQGAPTDEWPEMVPPLVEGSDTGLADPASIPAMRMDDEPDLPVIEPGDVPVESDAPVGPPRFVQVGAVALGLPVVAEAVRMAADAGADAAQDQTDGVPDPAPAESPAVDQPEPLGIGDAAQFIDAGDVAMAPVDDAGAAQPVPAGDAPLVGTGDALAPPDAGGNTGGLSAWVADAVSVDAAPVEDAVAPDAPVMVVQGDAADDMEVVPLALTGGAVIAAGEDAAPESPASENPIHPIPDSLRLAESFPVDADILSPGDAAGPLSAAPVADSAPVDVAPAGWDALAATEQPDADAAPVVEEADVAPPLAGAGDGKSVDHVEPVATGQVEAADAAPFDLAEMAADAASDGAVQGAPPAVAAIALAGPLGLAAGQFPAAAPDAPEVAVPDHAAAGWLKQTIAGEAVDVAGIVPSADVDGADQAPAAAPPALDAPVDAGSPQGADAPPADAAPVDPLASNALLEGAMGAAAIGGLSVFAAASQWAKGLAGHLDAGDAVSVPTPLADEDAVPLGDAIAPVVDADPVATDDAPAGDTPDVAEDAPAPLDVAPADEALVAPVAAGAAALAGAAGLASLTDRLPPPAEQPGAGPFRIADVVERIEAYQRRQADAPASATPAPAPADGFRFEADARGVVRWVEGVSRGAVIGLSLDQTAVPGGAGFDASVAGAFRHRASFSNARLLVAGDSDASGDWLVSAVPGFDSQSGRFSGYRGAARRPRSDERADQPRALRPSPVESLRELIHELRTPAGAITGFAEMIEAQMLGPVPEAYREQAMAIRTDARELLAIIDDLDFAARIEARALELRPGHVPLKPLIATIAGQLAPLSAKRGVLLIQPEADHAARGDERAIDRLLARLLATVVGAGVEGEQIAIGIAPEGGDTVRIDITRPAGLNADAPAEPGEGDHVALGTGFALRLATNLAQELGGSLFFGADRLTLRLPGADDPDMGQAVHH